MTYDWYGTRSRRWRKLRIGAVVLLLLLIVGAPILAVSGTVPFF